MFRWLKRSTLIFWSVELLILVSIIWLGTKLSFLFAPIETFGSSIFIPILISGVLYYLLNPVVKLLMKVKIFHHHLSRTASVVIIFLGMLLILYYLIASLVPSLVEQISNLVTHMPRLTRETSVTVSRISRRGWLKNLPIKQYTGRLQTYVSGNVEELLSKVSASLGRIISMATNVVIIIITVPVMLFYMLKDGYKLKPNLAWMIPAKHRAGSLKLLDRMSRTISKYIGGQMIECLFVGVFTTLGYFLIHQRYAVLLGIFAGICNLIPYVGPYIGIGPSLIVALTISIPQLIEVIVVVIIVQQVDGNLIYPNVIGKSLRIHPLTIIIILLAAGHIAGLPGMILAIPLYAVAKTVVQYIYSIMLSYRSGD